MIRAPECSYCGTLTLAKTIHEHNLRCALDGERSYRTEAR